MARKIYLKQQIYQDPGFATNCKFLIPLYAQYVLEEPRFPLGNIERTEEYFNARHDLAYTLGRLTTGSPEWEAIQRNLIASSNLELSNTVGDLMTIIIEGFNRASGLSRLQLLPYILSTPVDAEYWDGAIASSNFKYPQAYLDYFQGMYSYIDVSATIGEGFEPTEVVNEPKKLAIPASILP